MLLRQLKRHETHFKIIQIQIMFIIYKVFISIMHTIDDDVTYSLIDYKMYHLLTMLIIIV